MQRILSYPSININILFSNKSMQDGRISANDDNSSSALYPSPPRESASLLRPHCNGEPCLTRIQNDGLWSSRTTPSIHVRTSVAVLGAENAVASDLTEKRIHCHVNARRQKVGLGTRSAEERACYDSITFPTSYVQTINKHLGQRKTQHFRG
jgi:hypothetical protein